MEVITKTEEEFTGNKIVLEGGEILEQEEIGAQKGTTIIISNLFYNTPVRYKFLKKDYTELGYIEDTVKRIALANPNVAIKLLNENKTIIKTNGNGELRTAIYNIYGKETTDGLIDVDYTYEDIKITGVIGKPEIARGNRSYQLFFVNKRYIKDKTLSAGAEQAFKGLLPIGKFGFLILNIQIEPRLIDVNVHPTKLEIRFQEEQKVFKAIYHAIREALLKGDLIKNTEKEETNIIAKENAIQEQPKIENGVLEQKQNLNSNENLIQEHNKQEILDNEITTMEKNENSDIENQETRRINIIKETPKEEKTGGLFGIFKKKNNEIEENVEKNAIEEIFAYKSNESYKEDNIQNDEEDEIKFDEMYNKTFGVNIGEQNENAEKITNYAFADSKNISVFEDEKEYSQIPAYKYCGSVFSTYIIIEMGNEMYIIDQHAAHERVLYEEIKQNYYKDTKKESQIMLLPDIITLSHKEKSIVRENIDLFKKAGFMLEEFGENTIRLIGVPSICMDMDTKELFLEILDTIDTVAITAKQEKEDRFIATIACKAAVKANMSLEKEEVDNLMKKLLVLPNPFTCPHGRPTAIKMDKMDLERKFNRRK